MIAGEWTQDEEAMQHFHDAMMNVSSPLNKLFERLYDTEQFGQSPPFLISMLFGKFVGFYSNHFNDTITAKTESGRSRYEVQYESYIFAIGHLMEDPVLHAVVQMGVNQGVDNA